MNLPKAIEIADQYIRDEEPHDLDDLIDALKLLIEAGKRVKWHKEQHLRGYYKPLPGETDE